MVFSSQAIADLTTEIQACLQTQQASEQYMGTVMVTHHGEVLFAESVGMASLEHQVPNALQTKYRIGSITKQFTAAALLQFQDRGLLSISAPLSEYLPTYPSGDRITLHHLLTHTAGVPNMTQFPDHWEWKRLRLTLDQVLEHFQDLSLEFEPGERYCYSNSGYVVLTKVIEAVSRQPYADYLKDHLLNPLGMKHTGLERRLDIIKDLACGYQVIAGECQRAEYVNLEVLQGAGGLYSTVNDLARWSQFLFDKARTAQAVLSNEALSLMVSPHIRTNHEERPVFYGYGVIIDDRYHHRRIVHAGRVDGFASCLGSIPALGFTIVVLSNVQTLELGEIFETIADILLKQLDPGS